MTMNERILKALKEMSDTDIIELWNEYCRNNGYEEILSYDDYYLDEYLFDMKPHEIIDMAASGKFFNGAEYFKINDCNKFICMSTKDVLDEIQYEYIVEMVAENLLYYSRLYLELEGIEETEVE